MFDLRVVSGNTSLKMGHRQSVYKITALTGIDGIPVSVVTSQGFEQVGESVDSMSVGSRQIGLIGRIDNFTGEQLQALNTAFLPMTTVRLYFEEKYWIDAVIKEVEQTTGRSATDEDIAAGLGISSEEYLDWQSQMKITGLISLNEYMDQGSDVSQDYSRHMTARFDGPEESVEKEELTKVLGEALELLTEKEKKVVTLYYYEDLTLKEISNILEVSESRVSQLHTRALQKMKTKMGDYMGLL